MRTTLLIAGIAALAGAGCGGSMQSTVPRPAELSDGRPVQSLFAEDTASIVWIDLASVRDSELYEVIGEDVAAWGRSIEALGDGLGVGSEEEEGEQAAEGAAEEGSLVDAFSSLDWVIVAATAPTGAEGEAETVSLFGGRLAPREVRMLVRAEAEETLSAPDELPLVGDSEPASLLGGLGGGLRDDAEEEPPEVEVREERIAERDAFVADHVVGIPVVEGVWLTGPRERALAVLARIEGRSPPTERIRTHAVDAVVDPFDHQMALVIAELAQVRDRSSLLAALRGEGAREEQPGTDWWQDVETASLVLDLGSGVDAQAVLQARDGRAARTIFAESRRALRDAIDDDLLGVMGLPRLLARVETVRDESVVRFELALDRAQAHLWWGRISGAVGAALLVEELIAGFFSGFGEGLGDFEEPDIPMPPGGVIEGSVVGTGGAGTPVATGGRCTVQIIPAESQGFGWMCHATVTCEGKTLYGGPDSGWFPCHLGTRDDWFVVGEDTEPTSVHGGRAERERRRAGRLRRLPARDPDRVGGPGALGGSLGLVEQLVGALEGAARAPAGDLVREARLGKHVARLHDLLEEAHVQLAVVGVHRVGAGVIELNVVDLAVGELEDLLEELLAALGVAAHGLGNGRRDGRGDGEARVEEEAAVQLDLQVDERPRVGQVHQRARVTRLDAHDEGVAGPEQHLGVLGVVEVGPQPLLELLGPGLEGVVEALGAQAEEALGVHEGAIEHELRAAAQPVGAIPVALELGLLHVVHDEAEAVGAVPANQLDEQVLVVGHDLEHALEAHDPARENLAGELVVPVLLHRRRSALRHVDHTVRGELVHAAARSEQQRGAQPDRESPSHAGRLISQAREGENADDAAQHGAGSGVAQPGGGRSLASGRGAC